MTVMLGILEPMCNKEEVLEIGASMEETDERSVIYGHHRESETVLVTTNTSSAATVADVAVAAVVPLLAVREV
jgi:uncharacterized protein (DUF1015 family)